MKRPRIYGDETRCRAAISRQLRAAEGLLDQAEGVRKMIAAAGDDKMMAVDIERGFAKEVRRWYFRAQREMFKYLHDGFPEALPALALGLPPDSGKPRHYLTLDDFLVPMVTKVRDELHELQAAIGVRRGVVASGGRSPHFEELHASGLVDDKVIDHCAKEMLRTRTWKNRLDAIDAAKELAEATLRAALDQLDEPYAPRDDLPTLMKKWRKAISHLAPPDPEGRVALDKAQAALGNLVGFLAEWRNAYGRGHGRPEYPPDLSARHARLAADAAETCVRFIATTMDDLELLPPEGA